MTPAGLILAAGESRRMGRPKALLTIGGQTFLDRLIALFSQVCAPVVVVLGHGAQAIQTAVSRRACFVVNDRWPEGQIASMQYGLRAVPASSPGVLFTLVDHPDPRPSTLCRLVSSSSLIAQPVYEGRRGHPLFFRQEIVRELLDLPTGEDARAVFRAHREQTDFLPSNDPGVLDDVDDPAAFERLRERVR